jgi:hypothetical protein
MQNEDEGHATSVRGFGSCLCEVHEEPLKVSTLLDPTTTQSIAETHETVPIPPLGPRSVGSLEEAPSNVSASDGPPPVFVCPTAAQNEEEVQDTDVSSAFGSTFIGVPHDDPVNVTTTPGSITPWSVMVPPTAAQNDADTHDTALRTASTVVGALHDEPLNVAAAPVRE